MKTKKAKYSKTFLTVFLSIILITHAFAPAVSAAEPENLEEQMDFLRKLIRVVEDVYYEEVDIQQLVDGAYKGVFDALDPYSVYYTNQEYEEFDIKVTGTFGGIGVQIAIRDGYITVVAPLPGTPAHRAGIRAGDRVVSVDDTDVRNISIDKVANMMRGEPGTGVKISVLREGQPSLLEFGLVREIIEVNPVTYEVMDEDVGYIRLIEFNEHASENVDEALEYFRGLGIEDIIMDLRDNPGGIIDQAVDIAGRFIPEGPVVHVDRRMGPRQTFSSGQQVPGYNLVVLVNGGSASASEIVAGAVQDTKAGTLVGTRTFGKGTVQQVFPLTNGARIKVTIAKYLTPNERAIDGEGITPDIVVENQSLDEKYAEGLAPVMVDRKLSVGYVSLDVLGAEQRLDTMGYSVGEVDGVFDDTLRQAVAGFQSDTGLYPYGVLDLTTQKRLLEEYRIYIEENTHDAQLEKAIELLKSGR
jgi:carboxyl-terminal processing protease